MRQASSDENILGWSRQSPWTDPREAFESALQRWSSFRLTFDQFSRHLERLGWTHQLPPHVESVYLCAACALGIDAACRVLDREYFPSLERSCMLERAGADFVDEVLQKTRERLLVGPSAKIARYHGRGSLAGWLRVVVNRVALDERRSSRKRYLALFGDWQHSHLERASQSSSALIANGDLAGTSIRVAEKAAFDAIATLDHEGRQFLHLHYVEGIRVDEIARCFGMDRSTVYRQMDRARRRVGAKIRSAMSRALGIADGDELAGLIRESIAEIEWADFPLSSESAAGTALTQVRSSIET